MKTTETILIQTILLILLITTSIIFTLLPAKTETWFETKERIN